MYIYNMMGVPAFPLFAVQVLNACAVQTRGIYNDKFVITVNK